MKYTFIALLFILAGCNNSNKYSYAIKDFRQTLQPALTQIVSINIVGDTDAKKFIENNATDDDLMKLSHAENPILRATALRLLLNRPSINHYDIIMQNLSDTAWVWVDWGEWGIKPKTVSTDMLENARWKDTIAKNKTVEEVILHHNYLEAAYSIVDRIKIDNKFYPSIREMAQRKMGEYNDPVYFTKPRFEQIENALFALAKYQTPNDVPFIAQTLTANYAQLSETSFALMSAHPNEDYLEVFEAYYPGSFYNTISLDKSLEKAKAFITSIASYKNERSARILDSILNRKQLTESSQLREILVYAIWNNRCISYNKLVKEITPLYEKYEADKKKYSSSPLPLDDVTYIDSATEKIRW
jgi:hypothetical protein